MTTSKLELMELYADVILKASDAGVLNKGEQVFRSSDPSYFSPPSQDLVSPSVALSDLLEGGPSFMLALAATYEIEGEHALAKAVRDVESFLAAPDVNLDMKEYRARRILDYVYPVV
ncbi:hypothetical protein [Amphritea japonica]|uniref:hypothetical protein n=1 Tax=Amphritea japonica TaxID=452627 RepID=UPI00035F3432|nr:hypothetical protein [Amphritea japonica]